VPERRGLSLFAVLLLLCTASCQTTADGRGKSGLPPPPPDATNFSDYQPQMPFLPTTNAGVARRQVFQTGSGEGYAVAVEDFLISSKAPSATVPLAGAAVVEVRDGAGQATVGERHIELQRGTVFTVAEGESLAISPKGEPVTLRTWIVRSR